jgi:RNA polymerase sigma factor (sigma-70 family)
MPIHPYARPGHEHESRITELRLARGLSYARLAELTGVQPQVLCNASTGVTQPIDRQGRLKPWAEQLCLLFEVEPSYLFPRYFCTWEDSIASLDAFEYALHLDAPETPEEAAERHETVRQAAAILDTLKPTYRNVWLHRCVGGATLDETGKEYNLTRERVRQIETMVNTKLQRLMEGA